MPGAWTRSGVWLIATACVLLCAVVAARAQTSEPDTTTVLPPPPGVAPGPNPVIAAQDSAYAPRYRFSPVFTNKIAADFSKIGMSNDFHNGLMTPWGSIFDFQISDDEKNYRLQDLVESNKLVRMTDLHTFNPFWNGSASYSDTRVFSRTVQTGGSIQDLIFNDKTGTLGSTYHRSLVGFRTDMTGSGGAIQSERTEKVDEGVQTGVNGGAAYSVGDHIVVQGRGALRRTWDQSTAGPKTYYGLGSNEDSLATKFQVTGSDSLRFEVSHFRYNGDRDYTDLLRGSQGAQQQGEENVFREGEHRNSRNTTLSLSSELFDRMHLKVIAAHDELQYAYDVQDTRFSRTVTDGVMGTVNYTMPWKTTTAVTFENNEALRDLGPQSIGSVTDKRKKVGISLDHHFTQTLAFSMLGSTQLQQSFYVNYEKNPRDRDQVDTNINAQLTSSPFKKISAKVSAIYTNSQFINIDSTQSGNNRTRTLWELRPAFTYFVNERLSIIQNYALTFDYSDYDFKSSENYLDRNLTFSNEFQYHPTKKVGLMFRYDLLNHDNGSYLYDAETGGDVLTIRSKDRRDRTDIRVDYALKKEIAVFAENAYTRSEDRVTGSSIVTKTTDGQIEVGTNVNYTWGTGGRMLRITVSRVKRFSEFGSELEKNYWNAQSTFSYPF